MGQSNEKSSLLINHQDNKINKQSRGKWLNYTILSISGVIIFLLISYYNLYNNSDQNLLSNFTNFNPLPPIFKPSPTLPSQNQQQTFQLKHIYHHNVKTHNDIHRRLDITSEFIEINELNSNYEILSSKYSSKSPWNIQLPFKSQNVELMRLTDRSPDFIESYLEYARIHGSQAISKINLDWDKSIVESPNITDKETIITLALMSSNAYVEIPQTGDWRNVSWNNSISHGWDNDGLRGHIFVNDDNSTVVISFKGTSAAYISSSGSDDTVEQDRDNDNLLFSCCCARVGYLWKTVCDCYVNSYTCDQRCLERELYQKDKYYHAAMDVYRNVSSQYPNSNIWLTGHSLGGSLASLVGRTFGLPTVTFEAPGELLATKRLHLPFPPGLPDYMEGIWHFGHTADPIFMGVCNGASSSCSVAGYAMETQCHSGKQCVYDVVSDKGWHVNLLNHRIHTVIDDVLEAYNDTALCIKTPPCRDCFNWNFVTEDQTSSQTTTETSTTSLSSISATPTSEVPEKCKKWTWYGRCIEYEKH
ncbi:hypothetical protein WICMUC_004630 [Wickerhamomyces mucosus]|uniref:Putative lipase ATG15 n=1 Tax=Wickerhamomyces mucosus TaxID=1378264 RepID=A0A9P8TAC0_9ASCO|nr:hypothetical protein WICMUC_004630 [Wickerhamomyces mucosus]